LPHLLLSFCTSLTARIKLLTDTQLLACLRLVAKIFTHIQSPVTRVVSSNAPDITASTSKWMDGKVSDQLEETVSDESTTNLSDGKVAAEGDGFLPNSDWYLHIASCLVV